MTSPPNLPFRLIRDRLSPLMDARLLTDARTAAFAATLDLPLHFVQLVLLFEDKRFWSHGGVDPISITRAYLMRMTGRGLVQGGSTIPEQLVKMTTRYNRRNLRHRAIRAGLSVMHVARYGHGRLLQAYLEQVYLGNQARGVRTASQHYFGVDPRKMSPAQSFFLAERIALPNLFRSVRVRLLLRRAHIRSTLRDGARELPEVYAARFGPRARAELEELVSPWERKV